MSVRETEIIEIMKARDRVTKFLHSAAEDARSAGKPIVGEEIKLTAEDFYNQGLERDLNNEL